MSKQITLSTIILFMVLMNLGYGQINSKPSSSQGTPFYIDGFDYPTFDGLSNYARFKINLAIAERTEFSIGGEHYRRLFADRFAIPIQLKQYLDKKTYILGGYQREWDLMNIGKGYPNPIPREEYFIGLGHDVQSNIMMEVKVVQPIGDPKFYSIGLEGVTTRLQLGTRLKF